MVSKKVVTKLFINKKVWKRFTPLQMHNYVNSVFRYYREQGFPYHSTASGRRHIWFNQMLNYDYSRLKAGDIVRQSMHGLSLAWSYMPHSWEIRCNGLMTPFEVFHNDKLFKKVIKKRIQMGDNMSDNGIRKMLKIFTGVQSVSNFRPTASAVIYSEFCQPGDTVLDMSSGFGGRLLGSHLAGCQYIGIDPSTKTMQGLKEMNHDFFLGADLYCVGSEDFIPKKNSIDFCFTSPPYYNLEKYSDEPTQSYLRYPTRNNWLHGYLKETFKNCWIGLKSNKYMAVNMASKKDWVMLEPDMIEVAEEVGFKLERIMYLALSSMRMSKDKSPHKYEAIYIFKKHERVVRHLRGEK